MTSATTCLDECVAKLNEAEAEGKAENQARLSQS